MNDCSLRIILVRPWYKTALEECGSAEISDVGGGSSAEIKTAGTATGRLDRQRLGTA
jgi:hypothetical protein